MRGLLGSGHSCIGTSRAAAAACERATGAPPAPRRAVAAPQRPRRAGRAANLALPRGERTSPFACAHNALWQHPAAGCRRPLCSRPLGQLAESAAVLAHTPTPPPRRGRGRTAAPRAAAVAPTAFSYETARMVKVLATRQAIKTLVSLARTACLPSAAWLRRRQPLQRLCLPGASLRCQAPGPGAQYAYQAVGDPHPLHHPSPADGRSSDYRPKAPLLANGRASEPPPAPCS
jgi:hypothetical protein